MPRQESLQILNTAAFNVPINSLRDIPCSPVSAVQVESFCWDIIVHRFRFYALPPVDFSPKTPLICHHPPLKRPTQLGAVLLSNVCDLVGWKYRMTRLGAFIAPPERRRKISQLLHMWRIKGA